MRSNKRVTKMEDAMFIFLIAAKLCQRFDRIFHALYSLSLSIRAVDETP